MERSRWPDGFECPYCGSHAEPYRFKARPGVLRCRECKRDTSLTAGTIMHRSKIPLRAWFWAAYVAQAPEAAGSAKEFQREFGMTRYETALDAMNKARAAVAGHTIARGATVAEVIAPLFQPTPESEEKADRRPPMSPPQPMMVLGMDGTAPMPRPVESVYVPPPEEPEEVVTYPDDLLPFPIGPVSVKSFVWTTHEEAIAIRAAAKAAGVTPREWMREVLWMAAQQTAPVQSVRALPVAPR